MAKNTVTTYTRERLRGLAQDAATDRDAKELFDEIMAEVNAGLARIVG